ncbi:MAG TPA: N-6 DNA methylase [Vicinamibacterales bacterium]|nr:N-6 DNA methylase [Vicinamibacterales bacterium]
MKGISGTLLSPDVLTRLATTGQPEVAARVNSLRRVLTHAEAALGPASGVRHVLDGLASPLFDALDLNVTVERDAGDCLLGSAQSSRGRAALVVTPWGADPTVRLRDAVRVAMNARWCFAVNGPTLQIIDLDRTYARRTCEIDLAAAAEDESALSAIAALFGAGALPDSLARAVSETDAHRAAVSTSLQAGVDAALAQLMIGFTRSRRHGRRPDLDRAFADALTVIYRILFLLFAEARGLVPRWHPVYRDSYTIAALQPRIETERRPAGLWETLRAITRLAHRGCRAGTLRVTPFNGRLFAPASAPLAETIVLEDGLVREALVAMTTRPGRDRRERISYAELGVEQLGAVYERVLDYTPRFAEPAGRRPPPVAFVSSGRRKTTGTFYTPRSMTEYLVRRTLAPLVHERSPDEILAIRVLDPAMGSGAFLVAACRYLAVSYERALVREGVVAHADLGPRDRAGFRRAIAQRCLYGVDRNPTAVQLARLSLWLATLAADRPLTFLDHRLCAGNSLVGATPQDVLRQPPGRTSTRAALPLFDTLDLYPGMASSVGARISLASQPDDTAQIVRDKERALTRLQGSAGPLARWRTLADAWCAGWFWPEDDPLPPRAWPDFADAVLGRTSALPGPVAERWRAHVDAAASQQRFFHWTLEFPEIFHAADGTPLERGGFDAVIGNPPWDALRADERGADQADVRTEARQLTTFTRAGGCYRLQARGHANLYQVFLERMLQLVRPGGRLGAILPGGLLSDAGAAPLRRALVDRCGIDALLVFDNRQRIFPIHRSLRFVLLTATEGAPRAALPCRFDLHAPAALDEVPDEGRVPDALTLPLDFLKRAGGADLAIPDLRSPLDRDILGAIISNVPALSDPAGWHVSFGRELNATDDRRHFGADGLPVLEGKHLQPFRVAPEAATQRIEPETAARLLGDRGSFTRPRLCYREVASATNQLTLIAAIVPAGTVTTHTVFCLKQPLDPDAQSFLCGVLNSYVANYLVRLRVGTHVTAAIMAQLRVPRPPATSAISVRIAAAARLLAQADDEEVHARLQADVARLYGLDRDRFSHIVSTFPLVDRVRRDAALAAFQERGGNGL